jgi:hypothetical protein
MGAGIGSVRVDPERTHNSTFLKQVRSSGVVACCLFLMGLSPKKTIAEWQIWGLQTYLCSQI